MPGGFSVAATSGSCLASCSSSTSTTSRSSAPTGRCITLKGPDIPSLIKKHRNHWIVGNDVHEVTMQATNYVRPPTSSGRRQADATCEKSLASTSTYAGCLQLSSSDTATICGRGHARRSARSSPCVRTTRHWNRVQVISRPQLLRTLAAARWCSTRRRGPPSGDHEVQHWRERFRRPCARPGPAVARISPHPKRGVDVWPDNETRIDLLGFDYLVDSLEVVLTEPRLLPVTVGVLGDWGSGKSSLLNMVADRLARSDEYVVGPVQPVALRGVRGREGRADGGRSHQARRPRAPRQPTRRRQRAF